MEKSDFTLFSSFFVSKLQPVVEAHTLFIVVKGQIVVSFVVLLVSLRFNFINEKVKSGKFSCTIFIKIRILMKQGVK